MRLLLVEDEARLARALRAGLEEEGYAVDVAADGLAGEAAARTAAYDALLVDRRLPGQDGLALVARLRADGVATPVLMLTALSDVAHRVEGLDAGADDYLSKPFAFDELLARLRALLRRAPALSATPLLRAGPVTLDLRRRMALVGGQPLELRPKELALLELFAREAGRLVTRTELAEHVWDDAFVSDNTIDVTLSGLRARLGSAAPTVEIETVRGLGYRLVV